MTTVIVANDYGMAATIAAQRGLGLDWYYPHDMDHVAGLRVDHVIWVDGWEHSQLSPNVVGAVIARMTSGATEENVTPGAYFDMLVSGTPFQEITAGQYQPRHAARERRGVPRGVRLPVWIAAVSVTTAAIVGALRLIGWLP